jgi:hypothetical protein
MGRSRWVAKSGWIGAGTGQGPQKLNLYADTDEDDEGERKRQCPWIMNHGQRGDCIVQHPSLDRGPRAEDDWVRREGLRDGIHLFPSL